MNNDKAIAIAKLKNGEPIEVIAEHLGISSSIVAEWADNLSPTEMVAKEVNSLAIGKAVKILKAEATPQDKLQTALVNLAIAITDEIKVGYRDEEIAKALNTSADTVCKLQNSFFGKGVQLALFGKSDTDTSESNELKIFRGVLRD
jgi:transposase